MRIQLATTIRGQKGDALVIGVFDSQRLQQHPWWSALSAASRAVILKQVKKNSGFQEWGSMVTVPLSRGPWSNVFVFGLGKNNQWSAKRRRLLIRRAIRHALGARLQAMTVAFQNLTADMAQEGAEQALLAAYDYRVHKQVPKTGWPEMKTFTLIGKNVGAEERTAAKVGTVIATLTNQAREMANTPGGIMTPRLFAQEATALAKRPKVKIKVLKPDQMKKLKMGAVLGVAQGSVEPPRFVVMEYAGGKTNDKPLVMIGKGVTFDSGGLNLKPGKSMNEMHMDMAGGAAVVCALATIADLKLPIHAVAIVPAVENMPSGSGYRPGDLLKSMSGKTIEIGNTDAEGRVILSDALTYAQKFFKPALMVDVATLTGAALVALGQEMAGLFTRNEKSEEAGYQIGEQSGDYVWSMPMGEEYDHLVKATFGDVNNSSRSGLAGATEGAIFLSKFVNDVPWIHLDIAPTMSAAEGQFLAPGATGAGVRWLVECARQFADGRLRWE